MKSVCFVVSDPLTVRAFLAHQLQSLARTWRVAVVFNPGPGTARCPPLSIPGVESIPVPIVRSVSPARDLGALFRLFRLYRERRFDVVHSVTPKAGLLSLLAGRLAGVPNRIHTFTGQVWVTRTGLARRWLKACDRLMAALATRLLADSGSQREFLVREGVAAAEKIGVLAEGSISGVDTARFRPDPEVRGRIRKELAVPEDAFVFLFTGRLNPDKGVLELAEAFAGVARAREDVFLLVVGPDEAGMRAEMERLCGGFGARLRFAGYTSKPEEFMASADVFCLPSHREGFGSVVIEAAAAGLPAIASRIYGLTDAIVDGVTGLLHQPGDPPDLAGKMMLLAESPTLVRTLSRAARERVLRSFTQERLTNALEAYYRDLPGAPSPA